MPPTGALVVIATGAALWGFAVVTPAPPGTPWWVGWLLTIIGILLVVRGAIGVAGAAGDSLRGLVHSRRWPGNRAPRTEEETAEVLAKRPAGWEYLYFAGCLVTARAALESTFLDHELRYAVPTGERVEDEGVVGYLQGATDEVLGHIASLMSVMASDAQERAFGPPGQVGDPDRIRHLAERWTSVYGGVMRWAARLRAANKSATYRGIFEMLARLIDQPVRQYRDFVDAFVNAADRIPHALATHQRLEINLELTVSIDDQALKAFEEELEWVKATIESGDEPPNILTGEDPDRRAEREAIQRDARRVSGTYNAMARLNGIEDTTGDVRLSMKQRVTALHDRLDAHRARWRTTPSGPAGFVHEESGRGPVWLRSMVKDLDYIVWQLDREG
jgi:hypothetical protein